MSRDRLVFDNAVATVTLIILCIYTESTCAAVLAGSPDMLRLGAWQQLLSSSRPIDAPTIILHHASATADNGYSLPVYTDHKAGPTLTDWAAWIVTNNAQHVHMEVHAYGGELVVCTTDMKIDSQFLPVLLEYTSVDNDVGCRRGIDVSRARLSLLLDALDIQLVLTGRRITVHMDVSALTRAQVDILDIRLAFLYPSSLWPVKYQYVVQPSPSPSPLLPTNTTNTTARVQQARGMWYPVAPRPPTMLDLANASCRIVVVAYSQHGEFPVFDTSTLPVPDSDQVFTLLRRPITTLTRAIVERMRAFYMSVGTSHPAMVTYATPLTPTVLDHAIGNDHQTTLIEQWTDARRAALTWMFQTGSIPPAGIPDVCIDPHSGSFLVDATTREWTYLSTVPDRAMCTFDDGATWSLASIDPVHRALVNKTEITASTRCYPQTLGQLNTLLASARMLNNSFVLSTLAANTTTPNTNVSTPHPLPVRISVAIVVPTTVVSLFCKDTIRTDKTLLIKTLVRPAVVRAIADSLDVTISDLVLVSKQLYGQQTTREMYQCYVNAVNVTEVSTTSRRMLLRANTSPLRVSCMSCRDAQTRNSTLDTCLACTCNFMASQRNATVWSIQVYNAACPVCESLIIPVEYMDQMFTTNTQQETSTSTSTPTDHHDPSSSYYDYFNSDSGSMSVIIGLAIAGTIFVGVLFTVGICVYRRRKTRSYNSMSHARVSVIGGGANFLPGNTDRGSSENNMTDDENVDITSNDSDLFSRPVNTNNTSVKHSVTKPSVDPKFGVLA